MLDELKLEQRLIMIEKAISHLQNQINEPTQPQNWVEKMTGSISDEEAFLEALEYGRIWRETEQIVDDIGENQ
ncbi:MAG: transferase hexapeptide repeat containing protein [Microcystaceae cyanobacterium]